MDYIANKEDQIREMLALIGLSSIDDLFNEIPHQIKLKAPLEDDGLSEYEGLKFFEALAAKNKLSNYDCFLGGGAYEHHIPAIVSAICSKSEFLTAYTPYQPEASQGMLQIIFEFQTAICALTGMDVSNASLYDGASACAEALLMALRVHKDKNKVLVAESLHPHYRDVVKQYLESHRTVIEYIPYSPSGTIDYEALEKLLDNSTAAVLLSYPNFFGQIEDIQKVSSLAKAKGALTVLSANPLAYGLYESAGELGVDIAVGDCQPFGIPLQFGGPYAGYIACRESLIRQLPGRIVGKTQDVNGKEGYVLTLQAREQHIRREKATSNVCTNQALAALAALISMVWYGKEGVHKLALTNFQRASYLKDHLAQMKDVQLLGEAPLFNEFAFKLPFPIDDVFFHFRSRGIEPGIHLGKYFPNLQGYILAAVTETKTIQQLDHYIKTAKELF